MLRLRVIRRCEVIEDPLRDYFNFPLRFQIPSELIPLAIRPLERHRCRVRLGLDRRNNVIEGRKLGVVGIIAYGRVNHAFFDNRY